MLGRKQLPVYLFTGFLEGGKTSFIRETLLDGQFGDGKRTLIICCEEGQEEIDESLVEQCKATIVSVQKEEDITEALLFQWDEDYRPHRVMIEYNGMWDVNNIIESLPEHWIMAEIITPIDASTFESYLSNMKQIMVRQFTYTDLVLFNRCTEATDRAAYKRIVRAVNRRAQILFETVDGKVDDKVSEELPFNIAASPIVVEEEDFGIFYLDATENADKYEGKIVDFKAQVYRPKGSKQDVFIAGRYAMTCCAEDVAFIGFPCKYDGALRLKEKEWIQVTAKIALIENKHYGNMSPVLYGLQIKQTEAAEEEIVYFT